MKTVSLLLVLLAALVPSPAAASDLAPLPRDPQAERVRVLDYGNGPAAGLLFLELDRVLGERVPPRAAWHSSDHSADDADALAHETATRAFDLVITGDGAFIKKLGDLDVRLSGAPLFGSELILVGPAGERGKFEGKRTLAIMRELFATDKTFFTPMYDAWTAEQEALLWIEAGVEYPGANENYVVSGRDALTLLLQAEDEGGYALTTEDAFALYLTSARAPEPLAKIAGTGVYRTHFIFLLDHLGFRPERAQNAERIAEWFAGDEGAALIDAFSLGGMNPFKAND